MTTTPPPGTQKRKKRLHFSILIFLVSLLFTFLAWDYYLNSEMPIDRIIVSTIVLVMGSMFSVCAGLLVWSLERSRGYLEKEVAKRTAELQRRHEELAQAFKEIKVLQGFIPMCASCKKIRNDKGYWEQLEIYIQQHSEAKFSHGLCQECMQTLYPEYVKKNKSGKTV